MLGLQQGPDGPGQVDGLGVGEDQQRGGRTQHRGLLGAELGQGGAQVGAPAIEAQVPDVVAEQIHVLQGEGVGLHQLLGEEEHPGAVGGLIHGLDKPQGELGELDHGAGDVAEDHQALPPLGLALEAQPVEAAAGLQAAADGPAKIQLAGVAFLLPLGAELAVDLPGDGRDQRNGPGDLHIPELGDIPVEQAQFRVALVHTQPGVLHLHLLLQQGPGEDRVDKVAVEVRVAVDVAFVALHQLAKPFPLLLGHGGVNFLQILPEVHGLAANLQILLGLPAALLQLLLPLHLRLGLLAHGLLADEEAVEDPVEASLFLPGLGEDGPQRRLHPLPVGKPQSNQYLAGIGGLLDAHSQPLPAKHAGEEGELLQIDRGIIHGDGPRTGRRSRSPRGRAHRPPPVR